MEPDFRARVVRTIVGEMLFSQCGVRVETQPVVERFHIASRSHLFRQVVCCVVHNGGAEMEEVFE